MQVLSQTTIKSQFILSIHYFKGDITKKDLKKWIKNSEFDHLIHLAAIAYKGSKH